MANFKAPRSVHFVDALPVTSTGKVQKPELRRRVAELLRAETKDGDEA
jgi:acyl-coenzyme A synthetase/AMP-(fatty) acid ligase